MFRLLIITQKVDAGDQLLGFFPSWIRRFAQRFSEVTVICQEAGGAELPDNVRVLSLGKERGAGKLRRLGTFYRLIIENRLRYDSVFVHMNPVWAVLGTPAWRVMGKSVFLWYTHKSVTFRLRLALMMVHRVFTASPESFRISSPKVEVTGHGIDTDLFAPDASARKNPGALLTVGRIAKVKNLEVLVDAVGMLLDDGATVSVEIVGESALARDVAYERDIRARIAHTGYADRFSFAGKRRNDELIGIYRAHDVFVHMSRTGSLDKTVLEALACGMKVVSCNDASRAFISADRQFAPDDAASLALAITNAMAAPDDPAGREYVVQQHNLDRLIERLSRRMLNT